MVLGRGVRALWRPGRVLLDLYAWFFCPPKSTLPCERRVGRGQRAQRHRENARKGSVFTMSLRAFPSFSHPTDPNQQSAC